MHLSTPFISHPGALLMAAGSALVLSLTPPAEAARQVNKSITIAQLEQNFPKSELQGDDLLLCLSINGCQIVALADRLGQVGVILILPGSTSGSESVDSVTQSLMKLIGNRHGAHSARISNGGRAAAVIYLDDVLKANNPSSFCWLGASALECVASPVIRQRAKIISIDGNQLTIEVPHRSYVRMQTSIDLSTPSRIESFDCRLGRNVKRNAEGLTAIASEYGLRDSSELETADARYYTRRYRVKRPLIKGKATVRDPQADTENDDGKVSVDYIGSIEGNFIRFATLDALKQAEASRGQDKSLRFPAENSDIPSALATVAPPADSAETSDESSDDKPQEPQKSDESQADANNNGTGNTTPAAPLTPAEARRLYIEGLKQLVTP